MQEEFSKKNQPSLSLHIEEEIKGVSISNSLMKSDTAPHSTEIDFSEVSSTSEDTYQVPSTSSKDICMDLYEEGIPKSESNVPVINNNENTNLKPKKGLSLLEEYADSGKNAKEDVVNSCGDKSKETAVDKSSQETTKAQCDSITEVVTSSESPSKDEAGSSRVSNDVLFSNDKTSLIGENKGALDVKTLVTDSLAKSDKAKEDGQLSASDSSDSEKSSDSKKDSKKSKKDKSKKKDKKRKKKKHKKQKQEVERQEPPDNRVVDEKKEKDRNRPQGKGRSKSRSRSRSKLESRTKSSEKSENPKPLKHSRSRSRDTDCRFSRYHHHSRSRSHEKDRKLKHFSERSKRSRSRSSSKRHSPAKRNRLSKYQSSRGRSRNRSNSPSMKRRERHRSTSKTRSSKRDYPLSRKRNLSQSPSPRKHRDNRKSRSPERHSHSSERKGAPPVKNRRSHSNKDNSFPRQLRSPNKKEHKSRSSPSRKVSHRTSSASDSLDSGHFMNIPLTQPNKQEDQVTGRKESVEKMPGVELAMEASVVLKSEADIEKQVSPSDSPLKVWEDEFDFVFTERLSPKDGTEKTVEDVLFGKEIIDPKTPDSLKSKATKESLKSNNSRASLAKEIKETKEEPQTKEKEESEKKKSQQCKEPSSKSKQENPKVKDAKNVPNASKLKDSIGEVKPVKSNCVKTCITDGVQKTTDDSTVHQSAEESGKSAFMPSKFESIPFLGDTPPGAISENRELQLPIIPAPGGRGLLPTPSFPAHPWVQLNSIVHGVGLNKPKGSQSLLPKPGTLPNIPAKDGNIDKIRKKLSSSPMDMEMSSPEGDIIDKLNEEFWRQQEQQNQDNAKNMDHEGIELVSVDSIKNDQYSVDEPYEPETGVLISDEFEEDLDSITDPNERKKLEKKQQKEKTKVQELIDRLHRQARVEEEVKHVLKAYYKHKDISKEQYKSILRRAVPQITSSSSAIDPERIRSFVKKCVVKMKKKRHDS